MATYKSAKKQLTWTMKVIEGEIRERKDMVDTYARLLENAQATGNQEDIDFWFEAFDTESTKLTTLESLYFDIRHPDIYDPDWK